MVNEEIVGGLISALSRGESLQKAMMSFYNAGYLKEEIEGAAKAIYSKEGMESIRSSSFQGGIKKIASKIGLVKMNPPIKIPFQKVSNIPPQKTFPKRIEFNKGKEKFSQKISKYGGEKSKEQSQIMEQAANKSVYSKPPQIVQRMSDYGGGPPKPVNKILIYLLVFILILLLGILAGVFLFKDDLISMFNNLGLG